MTGARDDASTRRGAASIASLGLRLLVVVDGVATTVHLPGEGTLTVGRAATSDIVVDDDSVSRKHAIVSVGRPITIEDCGSENGTWVSGVRLAAGARTPLSVGDAVAVGDAVLVLQGRASKIAGGLSDEPPTTAMAKLLATLDEVAKSSLAVLLIGETGVGKEVLADRIHARSARARAPIVKLNCASFPENLLESELFGYERGAFTGADRTKPGLFEMATGGTVFLDELGEMPLVAQAKLLRVIETREVTRLGSTTPKAIDVRFVGATNRDLRELVAQKTFRQDLLFRLNGITLRIPPLRERLDELPALAMQFVAEAAKKQGRPAPAVPPFVLARLSRHAWPGNIRELRTVVERAVVLSPGDAIADAAVQLDGDADAADGPGSAPLGLTDEQLSERRRIHDALRETGGNQTEAARLLGIARRTLVNRLTAYGIRRPRTTR